jgi:uncharacterized membrane protein YjdF
MIHLKKGQLPILIINIVFLLIFAIIYISMKNYEFILYIGVIIFFLGLIVATNKRVDYPNAALWGLTLWALMHMGGGSLYIGGTKLYELILIPLSDKYEIFRYDQLVHIVGFAVATVLMFAIIRPLLPEKIERWTAISIVLVMAGLGVGALNEIVEFAATVIVPETGVGGYMNTSLDLVSDLIGAILAIVYIRWTNKKT